MPKNDELNEMQWARKILNQRDRLHFLSDVFIAVAVVLDQAPHYFLKRLLLCCIENDIDFSRETFALISPSAVVVRLLYFVLPYDDYDDCFFVGVFFLKDNWTLHQDISQDCLLWHCAFYWCISGHFSGILWGILLVIASNQCSASFRVNLLFLCVFGYCQFPLRQ